MNAPRSAVCARVFEPAYAGGCPVYGLPWLGPIAL